MKRIAAIFSISIISVAIVFSQPTVPFTPDSLTRGLWHLNEIAGPIVLDTSRWGNNGTAYGTTIVPGVFGNARAFNGTSDYVYVNPDSSLELGTASFRVDLWIKTTAVQGIIIRSGCAPVPGWVISMFYGHIAAQVGNRSDSFYPDTLTMLLSNATFDDNVWHSITLIRDRVADSLYLYVDGALATRPIHDPITFSLSNGQPLTLGAWAYGPSAFWSGVIDEVRLTCSKQLRPNTADIDVSPVALNFGVVAVGKIDSLPVTILNHGSQGWLDIESVTFSNTNFHANAGTMQVPPLGSSTFEVFYTPSAAGPDTGTLSIQSNDQNTSLVLVPLNGRGFVLTEKPVIYKISLAPNYYGQARIQWFRSLYDTLGANDPVTEYSIWRRADGLNQSSRTSRPPDGLIPEQFAMGPLWDFIETVPALMFYEYSAVVPMLYPPTGGNPWNIYMVAAHTKNLNFYLSSPDSLQWDSVAVLGSASKTDLPKEFFLYQNYPNPFNPSSTLAYNLPQSTYVTLKVYDVLGQEIVTLVNEEQQAGQHMAVWDAQNLPSGIYFYRLTTQSYSATKKMLLLK